MIVTEVASAAPWLITVIVNVTSSPGAKGPAELNSFVNAKSKTGTKPKSSVMLPLSSSAASWLPPSPGSSVGSSPAESVITLDQTPVPAPSG